MADLRGGSHSRPDPRLEPPLRQLVPSSTSAELSADDAYRDVRLPEGRDGRPYVVLNMVSTVDGKVALNGSAGGIGSRTDRRLMRHIRAMVDGVMIGAATLRAEICDPRVDPEFVARRRERGMQPQPLAVAVSGAANLEPTNRFLVNGPERTVVLTSERAEPALRATLARYSMVIPLGVESVDLAAALRMLFEKYGVKRLLCEGGPSLNQQLLDAGLIDELFWTLAPKLAGGSGLTLIQGRSDATRITARMELLSLFAERHELYARYRLLRGSDGAYLT